MAKQFVFGVVFSLCLSVLACNGGIISKNKNSQDAIVLNVFSATTDDYDFWKINMTAIDANGAAVQLPLNTSTLNGQTYSAYETAYVQDMAPKWDTTFHVPASLFNDNTLITFELYGFQELIWIEHYSGGAELTIGQIKQMPQTFALTLTDNARAKNVVHRHGAPISTPYTLTLQWST